MTQLDLKKYFPGLRKDQSGESDNSDQAIQDMSDETVEATPIPLYQRGIVKFVFLGGIVGTGLLVLYALLSIFGSSSSVQEQPIVKDNNEQIASEEEIETVSTEIPADTRFVQGMDEAKREIESFNRENEPQPISAPAPQPPPAPEPVTVAAVPESVPPPAPPVRPQPPPPPPPQPVAVAPQVNVEAPPPKKSTQEVLQEYALLGSVGQFGSVSPIEELESADFNRRPQVPLGQASSATSSAQLVSRQPRSNRTAIVAQAGDSPIQLRTNVTSDFIRPSGYINSIVAGSKASARVVTPVAWYDGSEDDRSQLYTVRLTEPLRNSRRSVAFQIGTEFLVEVKGVRNNGYIQMHAKSAVLRTNGGLKEIPLLEGAVSIRGGGGTPLIATKAIDPGGSVASQELGLAALGALNEAGSIFNRESSNVVTSSSSTVTSSSFEDQNVGAALLKGATDEVLDGVRARQRRAITEMLDGENIWTVEKDVPVEIFVNQSFDI